MKKFYLHTGTEQQGPFDIEELKSKGIHNDTHIWYEGLGNWITADKVDELREILKSAAPPPFNPRPKTPPPPFQKEKVQTVCVSQPEKKSNSSWYFWIGLLTVIAIIAVIMIKNNPNAIPGVKVQINTPKPTVITSRGDDKNSELLNFKETLYATVQNQGGDGTVIVTFNLMQDGNTYTRTQTVYLRANESRDLNVTFDEVKRLGGKMTYSVNAIAQ
jgi:hypothetical protein